MRNKKHFMGILLAGLLVFLMLSIPHISSQQTVSLEELDSFPSLQKAMEECPGLIPGKEIEILEFSNLWSSWEYYILPCYQAEMNAVPKNGNGSWVTALHMVTACSMENAFFTRLCRLDVRNLSITVETEEETLLSSKVRIDPGDRMYDTWGKSSVALEDVFSCSNSPAVRIHFLTATAMGTQEENKMVSGSYVWDFDLYCCGKRIQEYRKIRLTQDYVVNAV